MRYHSQNCSRKLGLLPLMNVTLSSNVYAKLGKMESILQAPKERAYTKFYFDIKQLDQTKDVRCRYYFLLATDAVGMGVGNCAVKLVIQYDVDKIVTSSSEIKCELTPVA
ncbi:hypothetical protein V8E54_001200 [Elaphomyces granulatus]